MRPFILIKIGPPGSGKTSVIPKIHKELGISNNYTKTSANAIVEADPNYINQTRKFAEKHNKKMRKVECNKLGNIYKKRIKELNVINLIGKELDNNLNTGNNVSVEITGTTIPHWLFTPSRLDNMLKYNYRVILVYTYAPNNVLIERVHRRAIEEYNAGGAFRDISDCDIKEISIKSQLNFYITMGMIYITDVYFVNTDERSFHLFKLKSANSFPATNKNGASVNSDALMAVSYFFTP